MLPLQYNYRTKAMSADVFNDANLSLVIDIFCQAPFELAVHIQVVHDVVHVDIIEIKEYAYIKHIT